MPRVRDLLYRFRAAGSPGAAMPVAVPADHGDEREAELALVFAQFAAIERDLAGVQADADRSAEEIRRRAAQQAHALVAAATDRQDAERAAAWAELRQRSAAEAQALESAAAQEAARIRDRTARRMPAYVERVLAAVDGLIDPGPESGHSGQSTEQADR